MKNKFLNLPEKTRINAFNQVAEKKGITPFAVEKDWWVTQSLSIIFEMEEDCTETETFCAQKFNTQGM